MNDGLISTLGFVVGMSGAFVPNRIIIIAAFAELLAGGVSMTVGAYLSIKSQREYFEAEIKRERREIEIAPELEREEVRVIYRRKGFNKEELDMIVNKLTSDKEQWVSTMMEEELRLFPDQFARPNRVAALIGISFAVGSLIPIIPFIFINSSYCIFVSTGFSVASLFGIGAGKSPATEKNWIKSGLEMAIIGMVASAFCYLVGTLFSYIGA